ncbi:MAG: hypothetical protein ACRDHX_03270 [Chloroflexota bacterium]
MDFGSILASPAGAAALGLLGVIVGALGTKWLDSFRRASDRRIDFYNWKVQRYDAVVYHLSSGDSQERLANIRKARLFASDDVFERLREIEDASKTGLDAQAVTTLLAAMRRDLANWRWRLWRIAPWRLRLPWKLFRTNEPG